MAWAEFLWRIIEEAPEVAAAYIALYLFWRQQRAGARHIVVELHDTVTLSDRVQPAVLKLGPAHGTSSTRLGLTTGTPAVQEANLLNLMTELDPDFPQF